MRFYLNPVLLLLIPTLSLAYFPFTTEDAGTIGRTFGFELENNFTYFRYYDGTYHQDYIFQIAMGLAPNLDLAVFVPYSKFYDGEKTEGLNDVGFYIKHIPYQKRLRLGYLLQVNFDTGKEGIGYGRTTGNVNLIAETTHMGTTYGINLVYIKSGHVEELRDSYGATLGVFREYGNILSYGLELKVLTPEDREVNTLDTHALLGMVYHWKNRDIALGFHKTLTRHSSFVDYGLLAGIKLSF
ncbi:hypothetical protein [Hydrogenivirga caldilitoris]|uniref:hypothetical protein n=1 Tax=Hydrogenivirga caldilitoris TaxID=246264 RepID=UPI000EB316F6|nr:hypothetical protein [Hydrogenivirga caldilitoris]